MAFSLFELSRFLGRKVALYRFMRGTLVLRYTSADRDITVGGETFVACRGISHSEIRETTASAKKNEVVISVPFRLDPTAADAPPSQALGQWWLPWPPGQVVQVSIMAMHLGDPDEETNVEWLGRVIAPSFDDTTMRLTCDPSFRTPRSYGRQPRIGRNCDVPIYSQGLGMCNLVKSEHALPATLTDVSGLALTAAAFGTAPRNLGGGSLEWERVDGLMEQRTIWSHVGDTIVIDYGATDLAAGLAVTVYPGCAHNREACIAFDNLPNYPGYSNLPTTNPLPRSQAW